MLFHALLLFCVNHIEENNKRNLPETISENKRNNILRKIFGTHLCKGLVDSETLQEFDKNVSVFYEQLSMDERSLQAISKNRRRLLPSTK